MKMPVSSQTLVATSKIKPSLLALAIAGLIGSVPAHAAVSCVNNAWAASKVYVGGQQASSKAKKC